MEERENGCAKGVQGVEEEGRGVKSGVSHWVNKTQVRCREEIWRGTGERGRKGKKKISFFSNCWCFD